MQCSAVQSVQGPFASLQGQGEERGRVRSIRDVLSTQYIPSTCREVKRWEGVLDKKAPEGYE